MQWLPEDFIAVGDDHVVVPLRMHMRGKGSGAEVEAQTNNVWTLRDGKAVRIGVYNSRAEALEAASLPK